MAAGAPKRSDAAAVNPHPKGFPIMSEYDPGTQPHGPADDQYAAQTAGNPLADSPTFYGQEDGPACCGGSAEPADAASQAAPCC